MKNLKRTIQQALQKSALGRVLLKRAFDWHFLKIAQKAGLTMGIKVSLAGERLIIQKGSRRLMVSSKHVIYAYNLVLDFEVLFAAVEPELSADGSLVDYSTPRWHQLRGSGKRVFLTNFSEGESLNSLYCQLARIGPGDVVLDLGANCGLAALSFSTAVGSSGLVIALEPDPLNYDALLENLSAHHVENVRPLCAGIWSQTGHVAFDADGSMGATVVNQPGQLPRGQITSIPVVSLADLVKQFALPRVDFVKMDIEGAEFDVILGATEFLDRYRARWVIEIHDRHRLGQLTAAFQAKGYETEIVSQSESHDYPLLVAVPGPVP